jgi:hypothetical protein
MSGDFSTNATIPGMSCVYRAAFILAGSAFSLFYAWYAVTILVTGGRPLTIASERKLPLESRHHWSWWFHQVWVNLGGSVIGWSAGYYLIFCRGKVESLLDAFFLLVAMIGMFGFLPWRLFNSSLK